jgi:hypothetical protein
MSSRASILAIGAATLLVAACGGEKVSVYRVPKEKDPVMPAAAPAEAGGGPAQAPGAAMADTSVPTAAGADLAWQAPASWVSKPAGSMRKATYGVPGGGAVSELSITAFPGDVGGELANVNRWRGQVGLPRLAEGDLESSVSRVEANGLKFTVVELIPATEGANGILGAIVPFGGTTWFFKLMGPVPALRASKAEFIAFLQSVRAP